MASLLKRAEALGQKLSKTASGKAVDTQVLREYVETAIAAAHRAEASKAVTGFFGMGSGLTGIIEDVLSIATPLASIAGDFELSNLLGSLKVWLDKKIAQEAAEQAQRNQMFSATDDSMWSGYSF